MTKRIGGSDVKKMICLAVLAATAMTTGAQAQQFSASADIYQSEGGSIWGSSYTGVGSGASLNANPAGAIYDGGRDAFDNYGAYLNLGSLTHTRQTLMLGNNTYRFFDTFTNASSRSTVLQNVVFTGDLGSDDLTQIVTATPGLRVTCEGSGGNCSGDPVIASVYSNNGSGVVTYTQGYHGPADRYNVTFQLSVAAGESVSLLNYVYLASNVNGTNNTDIGIANARGLSLQQAPNVIGLTQTQLSQVRNFDLSALPAVPEPATWAMMIGGFGIVGGALRRRSTSQGLATA